MKSANTKPLRGRLPSPSGATSATNWAGSRKSKKPSAVATRTYDYNYDPAGRLVEVKLNGTIQSSYGYDSNGNRE